MQTCLFRCENNEIILGIPLASGIFHCTPVRELKLKKHQNIPVLSNENGF